MNLRTMMSLNPKMKEKLSFLGQSLVGFCHIFAQLFLFFRNEASEKIIKKIEKWSVLLYLAAMVISIIIVMYDLFKSYQGTGENGSIIQSEN